MKIGLLSDTHGYLDPQVFKYFTETDEIWHAGDIGNLTVYTELKAFKPLVAVFGNIDPPQVRHLLSEDEIFDREGLKIWMTHIGGYPPKYNGHIRKRLDEIRPGLFICGHSHILKVIPDQQRKPLLHINPGAAGQQGFHKYRTIVRFALKHGAIRDLEVIRLGVRGK
jgi:putative phosphoesterase